MPPRTLFDAASKGGHLAKRAITMGAKPLADAAPTPPAPPAPLSLRPYQKDAAENVKDVWRRNGAPMMKLPTGAGKTEVAIELADGQRTLFVTSRSTLMTQGALRFTSHGRRAAYTGARIPRSAARHIPAEDWPRSHWPTGVDVLFCTPTTAARRNLLEQQIDLAVFDEAHHCAMRDGEANAPLYARVASALMKGGVRTLGLTATPARTESDWGFRSVGFTEIVEGPTYDALVADGYLAPMRVATGIAEIKHGAVDAKTGDYDVSAIMKANSDQTMIDIPAEHAASVPGRIIIFCVRQSHAKALAARLAQVHGERVALTLSGAASEQGVICDPQAIPAFETGEARILVGVGKMTEGFDCPAADRVMLLRPTQSAILLIQCAGRASRPADGKDEAIFEDWTNSVPYLGSPTAPREWSIYSRDERERMEVAQRPKEERGEGDGGGEDPEAVKRRVTRRIKEGARLPTDAERARSAYCACEHNCWRAFPKQVGSAEWDCGCDEHLCEMRAFNGGSVPCGCRKPAPHAFLTSMTSSKSGKRIFRWNW